MKKIFLYLFILISFFFITKIGVNAQLQSNSILVPGVNCGVAGDIKTSKCCAPVKFEFTKGPDISSAFSSLRDLVLQPGLDYIKTIINPFISFQDQLIIPCQIGKKSPNNVDASDINCQCVFDALAPLPGSLQSLNKFCENQTKAVDKSNCTGCIEGGGVWTGIGCVQGSIDQFIGQTIFGWGIGFAGGFSLLCIIYAAFMMQSSQGNPEKLKKAQEMITSCIMGLMLIIFSAFILKLIGVNILKIPGFQ